MIDRFDPAIITERLADVRERTLALIAPLDWPSLRKQHISILSPMVWDLGHIGMFEELWLLSELGGGGPEHEEYGKMFDPMVNPRNVRDGLPLPDRATLFDYLQRVRERVLDHQDRLTAGGSDNGRRRLLSDGFVYEMVAEHEEQHQETLLQALQLMEDPRPYSPGVRRALPKPVEHPEGMALIAGGHFRIGVDTSRPGAGFAYDNEGSAHEAYLPDFYLDVAPVTCGRYLAFVEDGGYEKRDLWSEAGWKYKVDEGLISPRYWSKTGRGWRVRRFDRTLDLPVHEPVMNVTHHEAEAFARWDGSRLPKEAEWEKAALWDPETEVSRRFPWGDEPWTPELANLDQLGFGPAEVGAYPKGVSAYGIHQMLGDVWEWTSSEFRAYPNFEAFPYKEYSESHFGPDYVVLRGSSWATRPAVARGTFRNWDYPIRSQIMSGFRCARNA